jgi:hypothetical protein
MDRTVFSAFPALVARIKVFIMRSSYLVGCWGRRLVSESLCIMAQIHLEWSRIPAWGAGGPGFKSQRPHHNSSMPLLDYLRLPKSLMSLKCARAKPISASLLGFFAAFGGCRAESSVFRVNECTATYFGCFYASTSNQLHHVWNIPDVSLFHLAVSYVPTWQRTPRNPIHNQASE